MSDNFIEIKMYECKFCHKLFKTNTKHSCKWNPEKQNCLTCAHCTGFVKGQGRIFGHNLGFVDYDPSYFKCDMDMSGYNDLDELAQSGWKSYCKGYVEVKCNDFIKHYADVMAKSGKESTRNDKF